MKSFAKIVFLVSLLLCGASVALADAEEPQSSKKDQSSKNFDKTKRFLPGEEVVTPTGKKVKVWSSEGPVKVSPAPEPFESNKSPALDNTYIVVDPQDSFDVRKSKSKSK